MFHELTPECDLLLGSKIFGALGPCLDGDARAGIRTQV